MTQPFKRSKFRFLGYPAAALAVCTSASQGILNGIALGSATSPAHALIFAGGSLAGAVLQPISWACMFIAFRKRQWGRAVAALLLGAACLIYATLSSLGFVSASRTDATAARTKSSDTYALTKMQTAAAVAELNSLANAPRGTKKVEAQRAERRQELERSIAKAQEALQVDTAVGASDPAAASLAAYASAVGLHWTAEKIAPWITAATVLFFEVCSGASIVVVSVLSAETPAPFERPEEADEQLTTEIDDADPEKRKGRRRVVLPEDVIDRIRGNGGRLNGSLASIAEQIGAPSKTTAKRVLGELEAAGKIRYDASADGTNVALC